MSLPPLSESDAEAQFGAILDGKWADADIAALLIALADRGETVSELVGAARAMRARMIRLHAPANAIDVCGTGGDGQHSLNVSTAVAIVVAACGVPVAKHGNRAASSKAGGADTLQALGLDLDRASDLAETTLADMGLAFLFAQKHHPALARLAPLRMALGRRTIFNLLGPLCNPAGVARQAVGVANIGLVDAYAQALQRLGAEQAVVFCGEEGLDELSPSGGSYARAVRLQTPDFQGTISPDRAGLPHHPLSALTGGDAAFNAAALRKIFLGTPEQNLAYRDAVLLNAAAALIVAGEVADLRSGVEEAREVLDKGLANTLLDCWIAACQP